MHLNVLHSGDAAGCFIYEAVISRQNTYHRNGKILSQSHDAPSVYRHQVIDCARLILVADQLHNLSKDVMQLFGVITDAC